MRYLSLATIWRYTRGHRVQVCGVLVLFALAAIPLPLVPLFMGRLIEAISAPQRDPHHIIVQAVVMASMGILHSALWHGSELVWRKWILPLQDNFETHIFAEVIHEDYPYFIEKSTGKISASIGMYADKLRELVERVYWGYIPQLVSLFTLAGVMSSFNWQSGFIFVSGVGLLLITGPAMRRSIASEATHTDKRSTKTASIIDSVTNFVTVKSFGTADREILEVNTKQHDVIHAHRRSFLWVVAFWFTASFVVRWVTWPAIVGVNVWLFLNGHAAVGEITGAITAAFLFTTTIWELIWFASEFTRTMASLEETHTYLFGQRTATLPSLPNHVRQHDYPTSAGLKINNVTFAYPDKPDRDVLNNVDLHITAGEKVGIVGHSGSGKTTLVKLLLGYYAPTHGTINTLSDHGTYPTHHVCTYVPQDTAMFNRSVAENIAYAGGNNVTRDDIVQAANQAYASEFIHELPEGYDTLVGERGVKLSGGQRQRIAIARALLNHRPVLILDEATSALDSDSELRVQQALENLWEGRTVVAIAHRLSTLRRMDRIVVMEAGRVIEQGAHSDLLSANGTYARLWNQQSDGFLTE